MNRSALAYIDDVLSGKQAACKWTKLAVKRHTGDLKHQKTKKFPYYFDEDAAIHIIDFIQELKHSKGEWAGSLLLLEPFQQFELWVLFGWKRMDKTRRFRFAYTEMARKNGKTTKAAGIGNYCFIMDEEPGAECYTAATKRDQAKLSHAESLRQIKSCPELREMVKIYANSMTIAEEAAKYVPLGADSKTEDGSNPHFALIDEYHAHPDDSMVNVLKSGMGSRRQPMMYIITTAGFERMSACYLERERAERILEGSIEDESYFAIIYTLDEKDDWTDERVWIKANPNIDVSVNREYLRNQVKEALDSPQKQNNVKTKNFNIWTQAETRWLLYEAWEACGFPVDEKALEGRACYAGLDLSSTQDLTAWVLCFPPKEEGEKYQFLYRFFLPSEGIVQKEQKDKIPYKLWADQGLLYLTDGDAVDYDYVEDQIREDAKTYNIKQIGYDPWHSQELTNHLIQEGFEMVIFRQNYSGMSAGTDTFEKKVLAKELAHGGNPIMVWMISCTEVKSDRQGNIAPMKPKREKSGKRIDGVVASIMALDRAVLDEKKPSVYGTRGLRTLDSGGGAVAEPDEDRRAKLKKRGMSDEAIERIEKELALDANSGNVDNIGN